MNNPHQDLRVPLKSSSFSRSRSSIDLDEVLMLTAMFIFARVRRLFSAKTMRNAFRTIGWFVDLPRIVSYAWLTLSGSVVIGDSIPFFVSLNSCESK